MVTDNIGFVEERGWAVPSFFPVVVGHQRGEDWSATRSAWPTPEDAIVAAYALWIGWSGPEAGTFVKAISGKHDFEDSGDEVS